MLIQQLREEVKRINQLLKDHKINARTQPSNTLVAGSSFILYGIILGKGESVARIRGKLPELQECITALRGESTPIRLQEMPLALEVAHPFPSPLRPRQSLVDFGGELEMLAGRTYSYTGGSDFIVPLKQTPHVLVAGSTGSGKSILMSGMITTLAASMSPEKLNLFIIDLKNEDLVPFARLPHVLEFASSPDEAERVIETVHSIKDMRVDGGRVGRESPYVMLIVDELAELARTQDSLHLLDSITAIGRSKNIGTLMATQKPTASVIGSMTKANIGMRLVGLVSDSREAVIASGRRQSGAELLNGPGSFIALYGPKVVRFQSYFLEDDEIDEFSLAIMQKWLPKAGGREFFTQNSSKTHPKLVENSLWVHENSRKLDQSSPELAKTRPELAKTHPELVNSHPELDENSSETRELAPNEIEELRKLYRDGEMNKTQLCFHFFGSKNGRTWQMVTEAIEGS